MKFVYIGSADSPDAVTTHGLSFVKNGDPVEVKSDLAILKLSRNIHFAKHEEPMGAEEVKNEDKPTAIKQAFPLLKRRGRKPRGI